MALFPQKLMFCRWLVTLESVQWVLAHPSVYILHVSVQFSRSVVSKSLWPYGLQHPGFPVHQQFPELDQTHVHWVGDTIEQPHPLLFPSPLAFNLSQHQDLFQRVSSLHQVAKILEFQLQHQSFQPMNIQDWYCISVKLNWLLWWLRW